MLCVPLRIVREEGPVEPAGSREYPLNTLNSFVTLSFKWKGAHAEMIGVLQMTNKTVGDGFDEFDILWAEAFAKEVLSVALSNLLSLHPVEEEPEA